LAAFENRDYHRARADFDRVLMLWPDLPAAWINRALARLELGDATGAIDDLSRALELPGTPTRAYFIRARANERLGDREAAGRDRAEGLRRQPADELSWIARGLARLPGDPNGAMNDFEAALRLNPRSQPALQNKASVLSESLKRDDEAIRVLDTLLTFHPNSPAALIGRGVLLARQGKRDAAIRDAQAAQALDESPATLYQAADVYALTSRQDSGDLATALRLLASALSRDPSWLRVIPRDPDLDPIRDAAPFRDLIQAMTRVIRPDQRQGS
jgi:tetratricopeptide (TPR) repeat protein